MPKTLSENAGLDPISMMIEMRRLHKKGNKYAGINVFNGKVEDMFKNDVIEPLRLGSHEIQTATEAATMILRIDDVIASKSTKSMPGPSPGVGGDMDDY